MKPLRLLDLFSGIGGFSLGLERSGAFETVAFCEIEPYCRAVLKKHWPDVPCYEDVRTLSADALRRDGIAVDAICGGFPCQDISVAGKGAGLSGERSGLWFEYARLIKEIRPVFVIIENVPRLRTLGADRVLSDLESLGYACEPFVVGAIHAGAPHRRQRAWFVAYADSHKRLQAVSANDGSQGIVAVATRERWGTGRSRGFVGLDPGLRDTARALADADCKSLERSSVAWSQCGPWDAEPDVGRVVDGLPASLVEQELRALGNAVVPQIPELIGRAIAAQLVAA